MKDARLELDEEDFSGVSGISPRNRQDGHHGYEKSGKIGDFFIFVV